MKQILLNVLSVLLITTVWSQSQTAIPDANFEQALINLGFDDVLNGQVLTANISGVQELYLEELNIQDLTGIQDFTALTLLYAYNNDMASIDVSNNLNLTDLAVSNNNLAVLDVSQNTALETLYCGGNTLSSLNVSSLTNLKELYTGYNNLTALDVSQNTALEFLYCAENTISSLDVSNLASIRELFAEINNLTTLDVSNNTALQFLNLNQNNLETLDVSLNTNLIGMGAAFNNLSFIDVSNNPLLNELYLQGNNLGCIQVSQTQLDATPAEWVKDERAFYTTDCNDYTYIPDANFEDTLRTLGLDTDGINSYVLTANIENVSSLDLTINPIVNLTGIEAFTALTELAVVIGEGLSNVDVSSNLLLTDLSVLDFISFEDALTNINLSNNLLLENLTVFNTNISTVDISANTQLTNLSLVENNLTSLDVSNNTLLTEIYIVSGSLTGLDVSNNVLLDDLGIIGNNITTLDVSLLPNLEILDLSRNNLANLDISNNTLLKYMSLDFNNLTALDVSNNLLLDELTIWKNSISVLDISMLSSLTYLDVDENNLDYLNVSENNLLEVLYATDNDNLACIAVNQSQLDAIPADWYKDDAAGYTLYENTVWYLAVDSDLDTFIGSFETINQCNSPGQLYTQTEPVITDCNDTDLSISQPQSYFVDADLDGFGSSETEMLCESVAPVGYAENSSDCNDADFNVNPSMEEILNNGMDDDCNPATSDNTLGTSDYSLSNTSMTPNPFNTHINISLPSSFNRHVINVQVFDLNARMVFSNSYTVINNRVEVTKLAALKQAPYFVKITNQQTGSQIVKQLIKL